MKNTTGNIDVNSNWDQYSNMVADDFDNLGVSDAGVESVPCYNPKIELAMLPRCAVPLTYRRRTQDAPGLGGNRHVVLVANALRPSWRLRTGVLESVIQGAMRVPGVLDKSEQLGRCLMQSEWTIEQRGLGNALRRRCELASLEIEIRA